MYDNINMDSTIEGLMNDNINMNSTIEGLMNDNINMNSTKEGWGLLRKIVGHVFNATFQWWKKPEYPERSTDHGQATGKLLSLAAASRVHPFL
jgi:hypothetical protein